MTSSNIDSATGPRAVLDELAHFADVRRCMQSLYYKVDGLSASIRHKLNAYAGLTVQEAVAADKWGAMTSSNEGRELKKVLPEQVFYAVTINRRAWSRDAISVAEFTRRGYTVSPARKVGDASLFDAKGQHLLAHLFTSKLDAAEFVAGEDEA